jgi:hypothetical protein
MVQRQSPIRKRAHVVQTLESHGLVLVPHLRRKLLRLRRSGDLRQRQAGYQLCTRRHIQVFVDHQFDLDP